MTDPEFPQGASPELGVVPILEQNTPIFAPSVKQGEILEQMTLSYVKNNKLPFTTVGLDIGRQIITDAVQKGMQAEGLPGIDPSVNIRTVVKDGLAQRTKITRESQRICRQYFSEVQTAGVKFIGPHAFPTREIIRASHEVNRAVATPVLTHSEGLVAKELTRKVLLPQMAHAILGGLPQEQFPDVTLELFPDVESQAKLLRNAVTSMNFRGNPLPQMQVEEVIDFVTQEKTLDPVILAPLVHYIAESSGQDPNDIAEYLRDLGLQTDEFFKKARDVFTAHGIFGSNDTYARDFVYKYFDKRLLLLHPALEEQELVTDYSNHIEGDYSLWDEKFSSVIDGNRIPGPDILNRALRLSIAKGRNGTKYKEALDEWKRFERAERVNKERKTTLERYIQKTADDLSQASIDTMPSSELTVALAQNVLVASEYRTAKHKYDEDRRIIERAEGTVQQLTDIEEELRRENGGELPQKMVLPGELSLESIHRKRLSAVRASVGRSEYQATDTFSNDFFSAKVPIDVKEEQFNFAIMDTATIEAMIVRLTREHEAALNFRGDVIPADVEMKEVERHIDATVQALTDSYVYLQGLETPDSESPFTLHERARFEEYSAIQKTLKPMFARLPTSTIGVPRVFYNYSLSSRISALERIVEARKRLEVAEEKELVLRTVNKEEFAQTVALAKIQAPTFGDQEDGIINLDDLIPTSTVNSIMNDLSLFPIPSKLEGRKDLENWTIKMISELPEKPLAYPRRNSLGPTTLLEHRRRRQMAALKNILVVMDSPFFPPVHLIKGQKTRAFMRALGYRFVYLNAKKSEESDRAKYEEKKDRIEAIAFGNYLNHLGQKKSNYENELEQVKARDPKAELISGMELLNLAVPEGSEV